MTIRWLPVGVLICCCEAIYAQQTVPQKPADPLAEVEINAQREKLSAMRAEMVKLEDQFYSQYNKLNSDHQYDMKCTMQAPTGSNLKARVCRPVFANTALEAETRAFLGGDTAPPANMVIAEKQPDFDKNMLSVINQHAELRKLIREREALEKRYEAERRKKLKGRFIATD